MRFKRYWLWQAVRDVCIKYDWYTYGDNSDYHKMLRFVAKHGPTDRNIALVAYDIFKHSTSVYSVEEIAECLAHETVRLHLVSD